MDRVPAVCSRTRVAASLVALALVLARTVALSLGNGPLVITAVTLGLTVGLAPYFAILSGGPRPFVQPSGAELPAAWPPQLGSP